MKRLFPFLCFQLLIHAEDLQVDGKVVTSSPALNHPQKGALGGSGERLILSPGDVSNEPYALGMSRGLLWSSVPGGSAFAWFTGSDLSARLDHMGTFEFHPGPGAPGVMIEGSHNGDHDLDWDLVIQNQHCPPIHRLAGFRLSNDGHLEVSNKITTPLEDGETNVSARLSFSGWTNVSDERVKKNIQPLSNSLAIVAQLEPVTYQYRWEENEESRPGFTAQNVERVLPSLVEDDGKLKTLNYAALSTIAIGAVKEQQETIEKLQKENLDLKARLERLENRLSRDEKE